MQLEQVMVELAWSLEVEMMGQKDLKMAG